MTWTNNKFLSFTSSNLVTFSYAAHLPSSNNYAKSTRSFLSDVERLNWLNVSVEDFIARNPQLQANFQLEAYSQKNWSCQGSRWQEGILFYLQHRKQEMQLEHQHRLPTISSNLHQYPSKRWWSEFCIDERRGACRYALMKVSEVNGRRTRLVSQAVT